MDGINELYQGEVVDVERKFQAQSRRGDLNLKELRMRGVVSVLFDVVCLEIYFHGFILEGASEPLALFLLLRVLPGPASAWI